MENKSIVKQKAYLFAVRIVKLCQLLVSRKKEYVLSKQLVRSGTSICANINEALQGSSRKDFVYKMKIALKEAHETNYWLELLKDTDYLTEVEFKSMYSDSNELAKILASIIITTNKSVKSQTAK